MRAIILAAGYGGRMRPLTDRVHKALLPIMDHTILGRMLDALVDNGVREVAIVTGYRDDEVRAYIAEHYAHVDVRFVHNARYAETNNIFSLSLAFDEVPLDQSILVLESDLIVDPALLEQLIESPYPNVALVDRFRFGMEGTAVCVEGDVVTQVIPSHLQGPTFDYTDKYKTLNLYKFDKDFCSRVFRGLLTYYAKTHDDRCYYELILGVVIYMQRENVHAEVASARDWMEVDNPNDLESARFLFDRDGRTELLDGTNGGFWAHDIVDFHFIRNMYFPPGGLISAMRTNLPQLLHNYGSNQRVLDTKLAYATLYRVERLHLLNGVSQVYPILERIFAGRRALVPSPTFGEYPRRFHVAATYRDAIGFDPLDVERMLGGVDVAVVVNPNNPSGTTVSTEALHAIAARNPTKQFVVDESFIDFCDERSLVDRLEDEPLDNVLVLKSLSKNLGVPGLRLGFVYTSNARLLREIGDAIPIWSSSSMAEFFLEYVLRYRPELAASYARTKADRTAFASQLQALECVERVFPSGGNFLTLRLRHSSPVHAALLAKHLLSTAGVYVKDVSTKIDDGGGYLRLAVRTPVEHQALLPLLQSAADHAAHAASLGAAHGPTPARARA